MSGSRRIGHHPILGRSAGGTEVAMTFDGEPIAARAGEPIAVALLAAGISTLRIARDGGPRGLHCAIGHCMECRIEIDGVGSRRACLTPARAGLVLRTHHDPCADGDA